MKAFGLTKIQCLLLLLKTFDVSSEEVINIGTQTPVLNSTFCISHPAATSFVAHYIGVREIKRDAFTQCYNLLSIDLMMNELTYIDKNTFIGQGKLETLNLIGNKINNIHRDAFVGLTNLKQLLLSHNRLGSFLPKFVRNLRNLQILRVQANNFYGFNETEIHKSLPKLRRISFSNGRFSCNILAEKIEYFTKQGIEVEPYYMDVLPKDAVIKDGRICIPDADNEVADSIITDSNKCDEFNVTQLYSELGTLNTRLVQQESEIKILKDELQAQSLRIIDTVKMWGEQIMKIVKEQSVVQGHVLENVLNITAATKQKHVQIESLTTSERKCLKTRYSNLYR